MVECGIEYVRIAEFAWTRIEPKSEQFEFEWLDEAIDTLGAAGLKVVMCTPTATPPKWLVDEMPDMVAVDKDGNPRLWGSRRHYDFSHLGYRKRSREITEIVARRYGKNEHVVAWQTDNEYGCHDTTVSNSEAAKLGFRDWLAQRYQSPDALNRAWGNVFWSMEINSFEEVELPNLTVTEPNPSHVLDFRRYSSDQVVAFNREQTNILREHSPGRDLIHNFMGFYLEFDHFDVSEDLDIAGWDSYPIGNLERHFTSPAWKAWYLRAGDPDVQAFHHDLYRGCGQMRSQSGAASGRMWVLEQQPGPVNWAAWNPDPHPGMVRLWSHEAFAHGAEVVSYFRWRQAPFAQEQFHAALNRPDGSPDRGYDEAQQVSKELTTLPDATTLQARVALVFDYASIWATEIQPQGADYDGFELVRDSYSALRKLGQSVDILPQSASFDGYDLIIVPHVLMFEDGFLSRLKSSGARIVFGPRAGSRTASHHIPDTLAPGHLQEFLPIRVERAESLRPGIFHSVESIGSFTKWFEQVAFEDSVSVELTTRDGKPAWLAMGGFSYLPGWPDEDLLHHVLREELDAADIDYVETGEDLRIRDRGELRTIVNYGPKPVDASHLVSKSDTILVGSTDMDIADIIILKREN